MIEIGKFNNLKIHNIASIGAYLDAGTGDTDDNILLPNNQLPEDAKEDDELRVFVYRDSKDRIIATLTEPMAEVGQLAYLKVISTTGIGAFLEWGLEKDLFLPFREQRYKVQEGRSYLVAIYLDVSDRLCATTYIAKYFDEKSPYKKGDKVTGTVYSVDKEIGAFVAVDNKYFGLIKRNEYFNDIRNGDIVEVRVVNVKEDGKLDLSPRKLSYKEIDKDVELILKAIEDNNGFLSLHDKSDPKDIKRKLNISKSAFKKAVGNLLKANKIEKDENGLRLK